MARDIDFNHIRRLDGGLLLVFREVMRTRQTTAAAARLGLTQSAVSHSLRRLRQACGDPLFRRRPDGLSPTARALELLPLVEEILRLSQALAAGDGAFDPASSSRHFRIGAADLVSTLLAPPLARTLRDEAPQARLSFRFLVGAAALEALARGEIDAAVGRFRHGPPAGMSSRLLWEEDFVVVARAGHPRFGEGAAALDLAGFLAAEHVLVSFTGALVGMVDAALAARGLSRKVVASIPLFLGVFDAVAQSDAIATVPRRLAHRHAATFGLHILPLPLDVPTFPVVCLRRATGPDAGADWIVQAMADILAATGDPVL